MNLSEVAKLAGVSPAAVSRYLNNGYLSAEKKEAIRKVVQETGCRRLGYIGAPTQNRAVGQERLRAYQDMVRQAGPEEQAGHTAVAQFHMRSGREIRLGYTILENDSTRTVAKAAL